MRARHFAKALLVLSLAGACETKPATQVIVELNADPGLLAAATQLTVTVFDDGGKKVREKSVPVSGSEHLADVPLIPRNEDATRRFWLVATLSDSQELARVEVRGSYVEDELRRLRVRFQDACSGISCESGQTCFDGVCRGSCFDTRRGGEGAPTCSDCQRCSDTCLNDDALACGCSGDSCSAGACRPAVPVRKLATGAQHSCMTTQNLQQGGATHVTYCWGRNNAGQLGVGTKVDSAVPSIVAGVVGQLANGAGERFSCALGSATLWCWGTNQTGQLGDGTTVDSLVPVETNWGAGSVQEVRGGIRHALALTTSGQLLGWGHNGYANLGDPALTEAKQTTPVKIPAPGGGVVLSFAVGGEHACAIGNSSAGSAGSLYCWGDNRTQAAGPGYDELLTGTLDNDIQIWRHPTRVGCNPPESTECFDDYVGVATGAYHTCALRENGNLYCFGGGDSGQLGLGNSKSFGLPQRVGTQRFKAVFAGGRSTCALDFEDTLWCWGALASSLEPRIITQRTPWDRVEINGDHMVGDDHACALSPDEHVWCWGSNDFGQLGFDSSGQPVAVPTRVCFSPP
ncbi:MAG: hypothetical protein R3B13_03240 [Polyangiaceae bacterium]